MVHRKKGAHYPGAASAFLTNMFRKITSSDDGGAEARVYWGLLVYLAFVFLIGGASRADVQSLIVLRPLAVVACGFALLTLKRQHLQRYRFFFGMAGLVFLLAGAHLIPLPPSIWQSLPGRDIIVQVESAVGLRDIWRPLTMTPAAGANAFFSLFIPLAALLMAVQLDAEYHKKLVTPLLVVGALSGFLGIIQAVGSPNGPFYFYRITNNGSAVGLFANRNHQALFLVSMIPLLSFFTSRAVKSENAKKMRLVLAAGALAMLVPLILVTGSRQGIVLGVVALVCGWFIFRSPEVVGVRQRTERRSYGFAIAGGVGLTALALMTVMASRAEALKRLIATNIGEENRSQGWEITARLAAEHSPLGSGAGSFVEIFQRAEPIDFLSPVYFNHAHNDFLETWLTFGIPGVLLIAVSVVAYSVGTFRVLVKKGKPNSTILLAQVGAAVALLCALASFVDYPLRTPSLACLFVIACCWLRVGAVDDPIYSGHRGNL